MFLSYIGLGLIPILLVIGVIPVFADTTNVSVPVGTSIPGCENTNQCFSPYEVRVNVGDTVTWSNDDSALHTVSSGSAVNGPSGVFDSSLLLLNAKFSYTFDESGTFPYFCMVHPWSEGLVIVGEVNRVPPITNPIVVINELDINPPGNDSTSISEWVELYNPTDYEIDLSGWSIASTTVLKKTMTIPSGTTITPGQFITYQYQSLWFTDVNESVELRNTNGIVIDKTPVLTDILNDFTSWQRISDGFDTDSASDWKFVVSTAGSSNGVSPNPPLPINPPNNDSLQEKYDKLLGEHKVLQQKYNHLKSILDDLKRLFSQF